MHVFMKMDPLPIKIKLKYKTRIGKLMIEKSEPYPSFLT